MKTILITGATSGFGRATAELLAQASHRLILAARRGERLSQLKQSLKTDVHTVELDITERAQVEKMYSSLPPDYREIDVLVNNAGVANGKSPAQEADTGHWEQMIDTNIKGLLYVTGPALRAMCGRGSGHIVNIGSASGHIPYSGSHVYGASKAFVRQFSRNLRADLLGTGVKVSNIEPGSAETEFAINRLGGRQKAKQYYRGWRPLTAADVARTIIWVIGQPEHVNIDNVEIMPADQAHSGIAINRE